MNGAVLGLLALALLAQAGFVWARSIREVRTGERRPFVLLVVVLGMGLGVIGLASGPGAVGGIGAGVAVALGALFLLLQLLSQQSRRVPAVSVLDRDDHHPRREHRERDVDLELNAGHAADREGPGVVRLHARYLADQARRRRAPSPLAGRGPG